MNNLHFYNHDCRSMHEIPNNFIQCIATSPPYWGLRKYKAPDLIWGGESDCEHEFTTTATTLSNNNGTGKSTLEGRGVKTTSVDDGAIKTGTCLLCGAWRGQLGLEPSIELYVQHSIEIMRECKRVLRPDGVMFWNIGDSYAAGKGKSGQPLSTDEQNGRVKEGKSLSHGCNQLNMATRPLDDSRAMRASGLKPKDLCLIPFRVALAAQSDGWWVRSVIIWNKPNPMPESVTDRPTDAYEFILMLTKSARYYWDAEAVRQPYARLWDENNGGSIVTGRQVEAGGSMGDMSSHPNGYPLPASGANLKNVWTFPTQPYKLAHFATFPEELPERCIKAATPEYGCCDKCGRPYERIVESNNRSRKMPGNGHDAVAIKEMQSGSMAGFVETITLGWRQACKCENSKPVPSTVLDPFAGSGTTLSKARKMGRIAYGYELSPEYSKLIEKRNMQGVL